MLWYNLQLCMIFIRTCRRDFKRKCTFLTGSRDENVLGRDKRDEKYVDGTRGTKYCWDGTGGLKIFDGTDGTKNILGTDGWTGRKTFGMGRAGRKTF